MEGIHLSQKGQLQARSLGKRLGALPVKALNSSPLERCEETIQPWLRRSERAGINSKLTLKLDEDLLEADYGLWSGRKLRHLAKEPLWKKVQTRPSQVIFPRGESMLAMQKRAMRGVENALKVRGRGNIILVSHGDLIKSIVAHALSMHLDDFQRIVIDPASISIIDFSHSSPRILLLNDSRSRLEPSTFAQRGKIALVGGGSGPSSRKRVK
jgi:probable phosphomutase (TIGR03848 family)